MRSQTRHIDRKHNHPYRPSTAISGEVADKTYRQKTQSPLPSIHRLQWWGRRQDIPTENTIILTVHPPPSVVRSQKRHTDRKYNHPYRPSSAISGEVADKTYRQKTQSSLPSIHRHQWWGRRKDILTENIIILTVHPPPSVARSQTRHTDRKHNHPYRPSTAISGEVAANRTYRKKT